MGQELKVLDEAEQLVIAMQTQNAIHGFFASVLPELGGRQFLLEWAADNPGAYLRLLAKCAPTIHPVQGMQGNINIQINCNLGRTELDA